MKARLTLNRSKQAARQRVFREGEKLVIGRGGEGVELKLDDRLASRRHLQLEVRDKQVWVTDLGSRNGTFVGSVRLQRGVATRVPTGRIVRLGQHTLTVETWEGPSPSEIGRVHGAPSSLEEEFEILGEIGVGAVGRVWAARQLDLDRVVAIKELRSDIQLDDEDRRRFKREADLYERVQSEHVVKLLGTRFNGKRPYLIIELVAGPTAKDRMGKGPLHVAEALRIGEHVALALQAISDAGVVHRDVKPQNILLTPDGVAKLTDLGIAKDVEGTSVTSRSMGMGTLPYAAPEQVQGASGVCAATDIYGLGATLYHLISGRPPFSHQARRRDVLLVIEQILSGEPPPLRELRPNCPEAVEAYVHRMLSKASSERPGPAAEVAKDLHRLFEEHSGDWAPEIADSEYDLDALDWS